MGCYTVLRCITLDSILTSSADQMRVKKANRTVEDTPRLSNQLEKPTRIEAKAYIRDAGHCGAMLCDERGGGVLRHEEM